MKLCILFIMLLALVVARAQNSETGKNSDISIEKGADATNEEQIKQQQHKNADSSTSTLTNEQIVLLTLIPLGILLLVFISVLVTFFLTSQAKITKQDDFKKIEPLTVRF